MLFRAYLTLVLKNNKSTIKFMLNIKNSKFPAFCISIAICLLILTLISCGIGKKSSGDTIPADYDFKVVKKPLAISNQSEAVFEFTISTEDLVIQTSVDNGDFREATSPFKITALDDGEHTLIFKIVDSNGMTLEQLDVISWSIDSVPPIVTIIQSNNNIINTRNITVDFIVSEAMSELEVKLNDREFVSILFSQSVLYEELTNGQYTILVRGKDLVGNELAAENVWNFAVDTVPPDIYSSTEINSITNMNNFMIDFNVSETLSELVVKMNDQEFESILSAKSLYLENLSDGDYSITVKGKDLAGNETTLDNMFVFHVDTTAPTIELTKKPLAYTAEDNAIFTFLVDDLRAAVNVSFDGNEIVANDNRVTLNKLAEGEHVFSIYAIDELGNSSEKEYQFSIDYSKPIIEVVFPATNTATEAENITIRGKVDDSSPIASLKANDVEVLSIDSSGTWELSVDLKIGHNTIEIEAVDILGHSKKLPYSLNVLRLEQPLIDMSFSQYDTDENKAYAYSHYAEAIYEIDLVSHKIRVISDDTHGSGSISTKMTSFTLDKNNNRIIGFDFGGKYLFSIDITSGERKMMIDTEDAGFNWVNFKQIVVDSDGLFAYAVSLNGVYKIDLLNYEISILSSQNIGVGPELNSLSSIALNESKNVAYVVDRHLRAIFSVNLDNGNRKLVIYDSMFYGLEHLNYHPDTGSLYALDIGGVFKIDINARKAYFVSCDNPVNNRPIIGFGPSLSKFPSQFEIDSAKDEILTTNTSTGEIIQIDLISGDRQSIFSQYETRVGEGENLLKQSDAVWNIDSDKAWVVLDGKVTSINLSNGDREFVIDITKDDNHVYDELVNLAIDVDNNILFAEAGYAGSIYSVDLRAKTIQLISGSEKQLEPLNTYYLIYDKQRNRLLSGNPNGLIETNITTGIRKLFSDHIATSELNLGYWSFDGAINEVSNQLYVYRYNGGNYPNLYSSIVSIDLNTGNLISIANYYSPLALANIHSVEFSELNQTLLVNDYFYQPKTRLVEYDLETNEGKFLFEGSNNKGTKINTFSNVKYAKDPTLIYGFDVSRDALMLYDKITREGVIISR